MNFRITLYTLFLFFGINQIQSQSEIDGSIVHDGLTRTFRLYIPAKYKAGTPVPLVFNLHGYTSNNIAQEFYGEFRPIADTANFIMVLPNGTLDNSNQQFWNVFGMGGVDDVGFLNALIDYVSANYSIDQNAIYSTGMSNGGFMSYTLACELSNRIAAVASVTGTMVYNQYNNCNPEHPVPVMQIHGTNDGTVPYTGSILFVPIESVVNFWVEFNNCNKIPIVTEIPDIAKNDNSTATHYLYNNGDNGSSVEFYKIENGGHSWPGAPINLNVTNQDFEASLEIWRFFRKYKLNSLVTSAKDSKDETNKLKVYPNPSNAGFTISFPEHNLKTLIISNTFGQIVFTKETTSLVEEIQLNNSGLYTLTIIQADKLSSQILIKQ